jgi:hypothetical protein
MVWDIATIYADYAIQDLYRENHGRVHCGLRVAILSTKVRAPKLIQSWPALNNERAATFAASVLAIWLGFLACVLGCAQPVLASAPSDTQISQSRAAVNEPDSKMGDTGSCCHPHHGTSDGNKQGLQTISCCPLDATLIQKQDLTSAKSDHHWRLC